MIGFDDDPVAQSALENERFVKYQEAQEQDEPVTHPPWVTDLKDPALRMTG